MQLTTVLIASAAFALASAKPILTNVVYSTITAGKPFNLTWANAEGPVSLILRGAQPGATVTDPNNLGVIYTIDSNLSGTSYIWNVPADIVQSTYAIEISDSTPESNYGTLFEVIGGVKSTTIQTGSRTASGSSTGTATGSSTSTGTESAEPQSATGSITTGTRTAASTSASRTASPSASATGTSAPAGGMASGLTSNLALVFVAVGALFMLN